LKNNKIFTDFILKEWLLFASGIGLLITSVMIHRLPIITKSESEVLLIIAVLFLTVKGLENSGLLSFVSGRIEKGRFVPVKLIALTFFLSMFITNDVALIVIVPLTLLLNISRKGMLVIFEALSANAGSALTPFGNPQNLYIYWNYNVSPVYFVGTIYLFSISFFLLLLIGSFFLKTENIIIKEKPNNLSQGAIPYGLFLILLILCVLHILPIGIVILPIIYAFIWDRRSLKIDYALLVTFAFFFGLADNLAILFKTNLSKPEHIFLLSAFLSQLISNVPTTILLAKFTNNWQALLWGTNLGGFGGLIASFANLIAYKFYVNSSKQNDTASFTLKFIALGYLFFLIGILLFFSIAKY
jgi:Na+/H+ antiporter NhaD/arsenite permease-like protein